MNQYIEDTVYSALWRTPQAAHPRVSSAPDVVVRSGVEAGPPHVFALVSGEALRPDTRWKPGSEGSRTAHGSGRWLTSAAAAQVRTTHGAQLLGLARGLSAVAAAVAARSPCSLAFGRLCERVGIPQRRGLRLSAHAASVARVLDDPLRMLERVIRVRPLIARARRLERRHEAAALGLEVLAACSTLHVFLSKALLIHDELVAAAGERGLTSALEATHQKVLGEQVAVRHVVRIEEKLARDRLIRSSNSLLTKEICFGSRDPITSA